MENGDDTPRTDDGAEGGPGGVVSNESDDQPLHPALFPACW